MRIASGWLLAATLVLGGCSSSPAAVATSTKASHPGTSPPAGPGPAVAATASSGPLSLFTIQRLTPSVGYIAGAPDAGLTLAKTRDNGATWQRISVPATYLRALRFIDERVGWAGGCQQPTPPSAQPCRGVVLRTEDGGQAWQVALAIQPTVFGTEPIQQIQAIDSSTAWALTVSDGACNPTACPSDLRRTLNAGRTWATLLHGQIALVRFASASRGWVALDDPSGDGTEIRMTSDGGTTWTSVFHSNTGRPFALDAASVSTAWLMTRAGGYCTSSSCSRYELFRTDNGGPTWAGLGNPKDASASCGFGHLVGPLFASTSRGWLGLNAGAGGVNGGPLRFLSTRDGGRTWTCTLEPQNAKLISAADPLHVWIASDDRGTQATTLHDSEDGGASWHDIGIANVFERR